MKTLLVIDNYDSFTYNLVQVFKRHPIAIRVFRSDQIGADEAAGMEPDWILVSPGPGTPLDSGISKDLIRLCFDRIPVLGVCLGMQCINEVFGGKTVHAPEPVHGKVSLLEHDGTGLFTGIPSPLNAARYHSLITRVTHPDLLVNGCTGSIPMALRHCNGLLHGVQFHPESFMTGFGVELLDAFLEIARR